MKSTRYAEVGIPQFWIVNTLAANMQRSSVEVYELDDAGTYQNHRRPEGDEEIAWPRRYR